MERESRHGPLILLMGGMEVCWLYTALLLAAAKTGGGAFSPALILSLYPVSWGYERLLRSRPWPWLARAGASVAGWLLGTLTLAQWLFWPAPDLLYVSWPAAFASSLIDLVSFPNPEQLFLVSGALIWWLGRRLAALRPHYATVITEFQFGLAMLLILFFMASQWRLNLPGLVLVCLAFFAFSFGGIALAHGAEGKGWLYSAHRSQWLSILLFAVCLVFAFGLLTSAIIKPELLKILLSIPKLLWHFVTELMRLIFAFLASLLPKSDPVLMPPPGGPPAVPSDPPAWVELLRLPPWVRRVGQIVVSGLWLILLLAALWSVSSQIVHWLRLKLEHDEGASYEPLSGAFKEDLSALLRLILDRLSRLLRFFRRDRPDPVSREAESARHIYRQLLQLGASAGCPRHAAQTPGEYLLVLNERFPAGRPEFSRITEHYVAARYSPFPPTRGALERMVKTWDRLKSRKVQKGKKPAKDRELAENGR